MLGNRSPIRMRRTLGCVPPAFQSSEQALVEVGGDVGVGLDDPVGQVMPEPAGLGDLGHAVGDEPGFVAVP